MGENAIFTYCSSRWKCIWILIRNGVTGWKKVGGKIRMKTGGWKYGGKNKNAWRWQKCNLVLGVRLRGPTPAAWAGHELGGSAPYQCTWEGVVWAARCCDGVMGCSRVCLFFVDILFLVNSHIVHSRARCPVRSPTGALLHGCFPSNLSITCWNTQGAIVKLHGTCSELCTLLLHQCRTVKPRSSRSANCSWVCWEEEIGGWGVLVSQRMGTMKSKH